MRRMIARLVILTEVRAFHRVLQRKIIHSKPRQLPTNIFYITFTSRPTT
jgi:hypothetical protein